MLKIQWVGGATTVLAIDSLKIVCDPVLCEAGTVQDYGFFRSTRLVGPVYDEGTFEDIDLLLLTHDHMDHFDEPAKSRISSAVAISNRKIDGLVAREKVVLHRHRQYSAVLKSVSIRVTAFAAIHGRNALVSALVGNNNGYLLEISTDKERFTLYISGDDVFRNGIPALKSKGIDLIIAYAGAAKVGNGVLGALIGKITNDKSDIIRMEEYYKPRWLLPIHWGTFSHYQEKSCDKTGFKQNILVMHPGEECEIKG